MKKRVLSMLMAPMLLFSITAPGLAAEPSDSAARLAAVTGRVKQALDLDTGRYRDFNGQLTEGELAPAWRLSWSGEDSSLEVTAAESGKILNYFFFDETEIQDTPPLSLPTGDPARARQAAAAFLDRVLDANETADLDAAAVKSNSLRQTRYSFRGTLLLNGCASPLSFSLSVRASDYAVVQFRRDSLETGYIGPVPAASFRMERSAAAPLLRSTLSLRLEYVLDKDGKTAVPRYLPNGTDSFYVDDASGRLVNLTELYEALEQEGVSTSSASGGMESAPAAAGDSNSGLTQAEQLGADKLKGTLSREALDRIARGITQLGLEGYTLASASYQEEEAAEDAPVIAARLTYARRTGERTLRRWVTLDAKTGTLMGVNSSGLWSGEETGTVSEDAARKTAEAFLTAQQKNRYARCAAYTGDPYASRENGRYGTWTFRYARQENGIFFPGGMFTVGIDAADGSVAFYAQSWTEDVRFDSPDGIIPAEQAADAYLNTFQITGGYAAVPQKLDLSDPEYAPLAELGYRALNSLKLGWYLEAPDRAVAGIDAKTGQPVLWSDEDRGALAYGDLADSRAKTAVETLAEYNIGYAGGKFRPDKRLTQLDLAALAASTQGILIDPDNLHEGDADQVYRAVYNMGALNREDRDDSRVLTRMDVIRFLMDAGGYGPAARLQGIYRTSFADEAEIPGELLGYAALAQAMRVVQGDRLNPAQAITRADAAVMLLAFMQRG